MNKEDSIKQQFEEFLTSFFDQKVKELKTAYDKLQKEFKKISFELERKNKQLEKSLIENKNITTRLNNILENINNGVILIDTEGKIIQVNSAFCKITGYKKKELLDKKYEDIFQYNDEKEYPLYILKNPSFKGDKEKVIKVKRNEKKVVLYHYSILKNAKKDVIGVIETITDLTKIKEMEKTLIQNQTLSALGQMAATVAHEIRNPLAAIGGFASLLDKSLDDSMTYQKGLISKITRAINDLNKIVSNLLLYTRSISLSLKDVNLIDFLNEIKDFSQIIVENKEKDIKIILKFSKNIKEKHMVTIDPEKIQQVLLNLIQNAIDAIETKGKIEISVNRNKYHIIIKIKDSAGRIDPENIEKIFTPFFTTKEHGTGLGLAISKKIIELHGGEIKVQVKPSVYTEFIITLPQ